MIVMNDFLDDIPDPKENLERFKLWAAQKRAAWEAKITPQMEMIRKDNNERYTDAVRR